jgi:hypothetical protein
MVIPFLASAIKTFWATSSARAELETVRKAVLKTQGAWRRINSANASSERVLENSLSSFRSSMETVI